MSSPDSSRLRRKRLINPRVQLRLTAIFLLLSLLATVGVALALSLSLMDLMQHDGLDKHTLADGWVGIVIENVGLVALVLVPLCVLVGIRATFPILGPLYRIEQFLRAVRDGSHPEPCRIRKGDEFQELCTLLNEVTAGLRAGQREPTAEPEARVASKEAVPAASGNDA